MFKYWALHFYLFGIIVYTLAQDNIQCNPFTCDVGWNLRKDQIDGKVYGYKVFINNTVNFFEVKIESFR
jgi:hypothetical protein